MSRTNKDGGRPAEIKVSTKPGEVPRSVMIAVPQKGLKKARSFQAKNIDDFVSQTAQSFKVKLRKTDGTLVNEVLNISKFEDVQLDSISSNSNTLQEQQLQKKFLEQFINEWQYNPGFRQEMQDLMKDKERLGKLISKLSELKQAIHQPATHLDTFFNSLDLPQV